MRADSRPVASDAAGSGRDAGWTVAGRYRLDGAVRRDGLFEVHAATDLQLHRRIGVLLLDASGVGAASGASNSADEQIVLGVFDARVATWAQLSHPCIARLYDTGVDRDGSFAGIRWIAAEAVYRPTLAEFLQNGGVLDATAALGIAAQLVDALQYAHSIGIVHGDLSTGTVHLDLASDVPRVRVAGFGPQPADLTVPADPARTVALWKLSRELLTDAAPEQLDGRPPSPRTDIWAVGRILESLCAAVGADADSAALRALVAAAERCTRALPRDRPSSMLAVRDMLAGPPPGQSRGADAAAIGAASMPDVVPVPPSPGPPVGSALEPLGADYTTAFAWPSADPGFDAVLKADAPLDTGPFDRPMIARRRRSIGPRIFLALTIVIVVAALLINRAIGGAPETADARSMTLPLVSGGDVPSAVAQLRELGLLVGGEREVPDAAAAIGIVVGTDPAAGTAVTADLPITLLVSSGPGDVAVPSVEGLPVADALTLLTDAGLGVGAIRSRDGPARVDVVLSSSPAAGSRASEGALVDLVVATGEQRMPDVLGQTSGDAQRILASAGFRVQSVLQQREDRAPDTVLATDPIAGASLGVGSTVTIVVSEALPTAPPPPSPVPSSSPAPVPAPSTPSAPESDVTPPEPEAAEAGTRAVPDFWHAVTVPPGGRR